LRPDGRIDQPSFVIDAEDPETAEVIRDDQVRLVSGSDCAEFLQAVAASGIYRRHFYGGHGRKTQLDCSSYIIINVSLTENVLNVFVVRTEGKVLAGQIVSEDSVYQSLKIVSGAPFADVHMDAAADLFQ